jgi:hypothetical protein
MTIRILFVKKHFLHDSQFNSSMFLKTGLDLLWAYAYNGDKRRGNAETEVL